MSNIVEIRNENTPGLLKDFVSNDLNLAVELLRCILSASTLMVADLKDIAEEILISPIPEGTNRKNEIRKRITEWLGHSAYSHLKRRRLGRGKLVFPGDCANSDFYESDETVEDRLSKASLTTQSSVNRESVRCQDIIQHAKQTATPRCSEILVNVLPVVEPEDSVREAARKTNLHPAQIQRAFEHVRKANREPNLRVKRSKSAATQVRDYCPAGVRMEDYMMLHRGATISYIGHGSKKPKRSPSTHSSPGISDLPRPRNARSVQHPSFGRGIILRERILDSGSCIDVEFDDDSRRTILAATLTSPP
jgi:hypothetical protein